MSEYGKTGHPVLGIVLGIVGIVAALLLAFLTGVIGGGLAAVLGLAAVVLGIGALKGSKKGAGIGSIVVGVLAVILAVSMTAASVTTIQTMKNTAEESGVAPLIAKYTNNTYMGVLGILLNIPKDEAEAQNLLDQMNELNKYIDAKNQSAQPAQ